jgi:hypothetical protein
VLPAPEGASRERTEPGKLDTRFSRSGTYLRDLRDLLHALHMQPPVEGLARRLPKLSLAGAPKAPYTHTRYGMLRNAWGAVGRAEGNTRVAIVTTVRRRTASRRSPCRACRRLAGGGRHSHQGGPGEVHRVRVQAQGPVAVRAEPRRSPLQLAYYAAWNSRRRLEAFRRSGAPGGPDTMAD